MYLTTKDVKSTKNDQLHEDFLVLNLRVFRASFVLESNFRSHIEILNGLKGFPVVLN